MNAPEAIPPATAAELIPLGLIAISRTNPRKNFDKAALDDLTDSVKRHGVLQPILVRPKPETPPPLNEHPDRIDCRYELVAGERRFRAAKAAGLAQIHALVRQLSDVDTLELQLVENLQRADLHPLEEAEGYEQLVKRHDYTAEDLAAKVGKSKAYVYARLKLCALVPEARKAFYAGKLNPSTALLVARIPVPDLQAKAVKEITTTNGYHGSDPMSYREAAEHLRQNYMLRLKEAPFDKADATLLAKAGTCGDCPKRTGNQPGLFGDVKDADVCTDPVCFDAKRHAHYARLRAVAEASGRKIIVGAEAKKLLPYGEDSRTVVGHVRLEEQNWNDPKRRTYGELAKKVGVDAVLVEAPKTKALIEVIPEKELQAALVKAGLAKKERSSGSRGDDGTRERSAKAQRETKIREKIFAAVHAAYKGQLSPEVAILIAKNLFERVDHEELKRLLRLWDPDAIETKGKLRTDGTWQKRDRFAKKIATLPPAELGRLMLDCALVGQVYVGPWSPTKADDLFATAQRLGVDVAGIRKEFAAPAPKKVAAKAKKKPAKPAKKKARGG